MKKHILHPGHMALAAISVFVFVLASASVAGFDTVGAVQRLVHTESGVGQTTHKVVRAARTAESMASLFDGMGYWLSVVGATGFAPRVYVSSMPEDLSDMRDIDARKRLFVRIMLPIVLDNNARIAERRARVVAMRDRLAGGGRLTVGERLWLETLAKRHKASAETAEDLDDLVDRIDIVPPSLVLAQAIEESGWGTSRFAVTNNSLFGQRVYDPLPAELARGRPDPDYRLAHFKSLGDSVAAYMRNVNSHAAYAGFRALRAEMRAEGRPFDSLKLAATLTRYSELGQRYVDKIQSLIRYNDLKRFDEVVQAPTETARVVIPES